MVFFFRRCYRSLTLFFTVHRSPSIYHSITVKNSKPAWCTVPVLNRSKTKKNIKNNKKQKYFDKSLLSGHKKNGKNFNLKNVPIDF